MHTKCCKSVGKMEAGWTGVREGALVCVGTEDGGPAQRVKRTSICTTGHDEWKGYHMYFSRRLCKQPESSVLGPAIMHWQADTNMIHSIHLMSTFGPNLSMRLA